MELVFIYLFKMVFFIAIASFAFLSIGVIKDLIDLWRLK